MSRQYWLMKSEPFKYSFAQLLKDGSTMWDGVRNYEARNNLRAMKKGDLALFYHSNEGKAVVGVARVRREHYEDPTAPGEDWSVVEVEPVVQLKAAVTLDAIRGETDLADISLLKRSRISVVPVVKAHFDRILKMGKTRVADPAPKSAKPATAPKASATAKATLKTGKAKVAVKASGPQRPSPRRRS